MDFGTYLKSALDKHDVNISQLAAQTGIKSKNTIYRLFENYYAYDKTKEITDKILSAVKVSEDEKKRIYELMQMCRMKKSELEACALLEKLYKTPEPLQHDIYKNGNSIWQRRDCREISIFLGHSKTEHPALAADAILRHESDAKKSLVHFVDFSKSDLNTAGALFSIIKLSPHKEYSCIEVKTLDFTALVGFIRFENGYGAFMVGHDGFYAETELSEDFFNFMLGKYTAVSGKPLKHTKDKLTDYAEIMTDFSVTEVNDTFSFEGMFCFGDIPYDVLYDLLKDADYLGLPPDSEYMQTLISATTKRYDLRATSTSQKSYILSRERLDDFFNTGRTIDHPSFFRNLSRKEITAMIDYFDSIGDRFRCRFFKPEFFNCCMECGLVDNVNIFMWSAKQSYGKGHFHTIIENPKALSLYRNFCNYFWEFCTLSPEESAEIFKKAVNDFLNK